MSGSPPLLLPSLTFDNSNPPSDFIGSPLKKQRASVQEPDDESMHRRLGLGLSGVKTDVLGSIEQANGRAVTSGSGSGAVAKHGQSAFGGPLGSSTAEKESSGGIKTEEMEDEDL